MIKLEINKKYRLKLGEADIISGIYLGIKHFNRKNKRHVFLVYPKEYNVFREPRFYLGDLDKTKVKKRIIKIKEPKLRFLNPLEEKVLEPLIEDLKNQ